MNANEVKAHRSIFPLDADQITVYSSFDQIIGRNFNEYDGLTRRLRWERWLELAKDQAPNSYSLWADSDMVEESCLGCVHLNSDNRWCDGMGLPALYNPITQSVGMACMGAGYDSQIELELEK